MPDQSEGPAIVWLRRDLRISDNPAIDAATKTGKPVFFIFIKDDQVDNLGAAAKWRLGLSLENLSDQISQKGGSLILRSGNPFDVLKEIIRDTGAIVLHYCREYTPSAIARDTEIKAELSQDITVTSHNGALLFEPWTVENGAGSFYKVYTPFWKAVRDRPVSAPLNAPEWFNSTGALPKSEQLADWNLSAAMNRGAGIVSEHVCVGEDAASRRLENFIDTKVSDYKAKRDRLDIDATSRLSENLTYGEISPRQMWAAGRVALQNGAPGAEHFLKEIVWREFAYHLLYHSPHLLDANWRHGWEAFPWREDNEDAEKWRRGQTGEPVVDAAMREMYVTGTMHNRARMIVASYLTKHLMVHWKVGMDWFSECLTDWDPAANAMGWQWTAGCGPDAAPFFRIFNPETQAEKFDPNMAYRNRFLDPSSPLAASFHKAIPKSWDIPLEPAKDKIVGLKLGRERALSAYKKHTTDGRPSDTKEREEHA